MVTQPALVVPLSKKDLLTESAASSSSSALSFIKVKGRLVHLDARGILLSSSTDQKNGSNSDWAVEDNDNNNAGGGDGGVRVWAVHKLAGEVVADHDPQDRPSLMGRLRRSGVGRLQQKKKGKNKSKQQQPQQQREHLKPVGRLDMSTEGLILVTNDGDYARSLELPSSQLHRVYRVRAHGLWTEQKINRIRNGGVTDQRGIRYPPMIVQLEQRWSSSKRSSVGGRRSSNGTNQWLTITWLGSQNSGDAPAV